MPEYIGSTKVAAWVGHITLSLNSPVKRAKELEEFTERLRPLFNPGEPLDVTTRGLVEPFFGHDLEGVRVHHGYQAEEASRRLGARAFTFRGHIFGPRQNLDASTTEGLGLLAHELTHVIQQTQPRSLPQEQSPRRDAGSVSASPSEIYSNKEMVLLAPARGSPSTTSPQQREAQAQASEQLAAEALTDNKAESPSQINSGEVAEKVYCLMRNDLVLERERAIKLGG